MYDTVAAETCIAVNQAELLTYVAKPVGNGPWPGVIVLHDAAGMRRDLRNQADWLASEGYFVAAPDLFEGKTLVACLRSILFDYLTWQGAMFTKIEAVRTWLEAQPDTTGHTGVIGLCLGGGFALQLAPRPGDTHAGVNYGLLPKHLETFLNGACPLVASYGARDFALRGSANGLEQTLTTIKIDQDGREYPDAGYPCLNHVEDNGLPWRLTLMGNVVNARYSEPAATDARRRIVAFFNQHLKAEFRNGKTSCLDEA